MARSPNQKAEKARELYKGGMKLVEIASQLEVPAGTVRRWKSTYHWDGEQQSERSEKKSERSERNCIATLQTRTQHCVYRMLRKVKVCNGKMLINAKV